MNLHFQPLRCLLLFLALAMPAVAQPGLYAPSSAHIKAGDRAPDVTFSRILSSPSAGSWSQNNLTGQLTVILFMPNTSANLQTVTFWNATVEKFAGKPVQFLWITGEKEATLIPWLDQHPVSGWLFHDPAGQTGSAYGLDLPVSVYIAPDRKILGFTFPMVDERTIDAALDGRITTTPQTRETMPAFMAANLVLLDAEPHRMPRPDAHRPSFPPSSTLHVSPSSGDTHGNFSGDEYRSLEGYTLKEAIEDAYNVSAPRIQLPAALDDGKRYNFAMVLPPEPGGQARLKTRFQHGIEEYFHLTARHESRLTDVYVVTADLSHPPPPEPQRGPQGSGHLSGTGASSMSGIESSSMIGIGASSMHFVAEGDPFDASHRLTIADLRGISMNGTADDLCHQLETFQLDRPVINETNLQGRFLFQVDSGDTNDFLQRLHDQLGLTITPGQRNADLLIFDPH